MTGKEKKSKCVVILLIFLIFLGGIACYVVLSMWQTEWGEYETLSSNTVIRKEAPIDNGVICSIASEYEGDFYRKRRICGSLVITGIKGECVIDIYEGEVKRYSARYGEGTYDVDYEWEHDLGDGDTQIIVWADGEVYDAVVDYKVYTKSTRLNYMIQKFERYFGIL